MSDKQKTPMTKDAAARIQAANAPKNMGQTPAGSFEARAQSAGDKNAANAHKK